MSILATATMLINSKPGCLSKSYQLKQKFDPKEYHAVQCNCPCDYWAMRGLKADSKSKCLQCGHAHNPGPNPYVPKNNQSYHAHKSKEAHPFYGIEQLIFEYQQKK